MEVKKTVDNVQELLDRMESLTGTQVLVGIPKESGSRQEGAITNVQLAYIHEFGSPASNIPARPFIHPGIKRAKNAIVSLMHKAGQDALSAKDSQAGALVFEKVGMVARNAVVREITDPAPPYEHLKMATVRARLRRTAAGRRKLKAIGGRNALKEWADNTANIKPLIDTGQLKAAITYVVRKTGEE